MLTHLEVIYNITAYQNRLFSVELLNYYINNMLVVLNMYFDDIKKGAAVVPVVNAEIIF